jgi:hypothetical protein
MSDTKAINISGEKAGQEGYVRYIDANHGPDTVEDKKEMPSFMSSPTIPVDMNYGFIPTKTSQEAKQSSENLQATIDSTMERFGLKS